MSDRVKELKAEIFDILVRQDSLKVQFQQVEEEKQAKLTELKAEQEKTSQNAEKQEK